MFFNELVSADQDPLGAGDGTRGGGAGRNPGDQENKSQEEGETKAQLQGRSRFLLSGLLTVGFPEIRRF